MNYESAIDKYPMLVGATILTLVVLKKASFGVDDDFATAIDAVINHLGKEEQI